MPKAKVKGPLQVNSVVEAVVNKLRRQLYDMTAGPSSSSAEREDISVEGLAPATYLERFAWNEAKYPPRRSLKETVDTITETIQKLEDDLKVRIERLLSSFRLVENLS